MYYYLYQLTNKLNGKIYVGVHKTENLNDGYMGSGVIVQSAIKKHGLENFEKVILEMFDDSSSMYAREKEIVTEEFLSRGDVYNIRRGGHGGFDHINKNKDEGYLETRKNNGKRYNFKTRNDPKWKPRCGKDSYTFGIKTETNFALSRDIQRKASINSQSAEANQKRKETLKRMQHSKGEKNSQFGTIWITNGIANNKIKKGMTIPLGWRKGRINGNIRHS